MRRALLRLLGLTIVAAMLLPLLMAAAMSFSPDSFLTVSLESPSLRWYAAFAHNRRWMAALVRSLGIASLAATVAVSCGTPLAFALARYRFAGRQLLGVAMLLPACVPPAVLGMGLLPLFYTTALWGKPIGLVLVHAMLGIPIVCLIVRTSLHQHSPDLTAAARGLGASVWQTLWRITLPLLRPALLASLAGAFAISLNESMITLFLATPRTETLPAVIWPTLRFAPTPLVAVASMASLVVAGLGAWWLRHWLARN